VWDTAHRALLDLLGAADAIAWERACLDSTSIPAKGGATGPAATRPTAARPGCKRHLLTEAKGLPVALVATGANRHDMTQLAALLDGAVVEPTPTEPPHLALDRGYDYADCRDAAIARGYTSHIPPKASAAARLPPPRHPDRHPPRAGWSRWPTAGSTASGAC
jgi:IS5 family transposase